MVQVKNVNITENVPLPAPATLVEQISPTETQAELVGTSRRTICESLFEPQAPFLLIVGPCSVHDTQACREYAERLARLAEEVQDKVRIVMRVYFEKPRTTIGWKGLIMDPDLDGSGNLSKGITKARTFLTEVLACGLPTATELLDPITPQYIADLICWSAIGARTSESQTHRQMASGLSMPVGFKNTTAGGISEAINGIQASMRPQTFLGVSDQGVASAVTTKGNPSCHLILRGGKHGPPTTTQHRSADAQEQLLAADLPPSIMIDASHANCDKDHERMPEVFRSIVDQRVRGDHHIVGAMLESHLQPGKQNLGSDLSALTYGQSITDPCLGWETTAALVREAAAAL